MARIHGIPVQLVTRTQTGTDGFNEPVYDETLETVENVLVGQPATDGMPQSEELYARRAQYVLGIPKGDTHSWDNAEVVLPAPFSGRYHVIGYPVSGIESLIPLEWNTKAYVERIG